MLLLLARPPTRRLSSLSGTFSTWTQVRFVVALGPVWDQENVHSTIYHLPRIPNRLSSATLATVDGLNFFAYVFEYKYLHMYMLRACFCTSVLLEYLCTSM